MFKLYIHWSLGKSRIRNETVLFFQKWKNSYVTICSANYTFLAEPVRISSRYPHAQSYDLKTRKEKIYYFNHLNKGN